LVFPLELLLLPPAAILHANDFKKSLPWPPLCAYLMGIVVYASVTMMGLLRGARRGVVHASVTSFV
jgi:hypothetical protein